MKIRCFKCNGAGNKHSDIDWFVGIMTFGMTILMDLSTKDECKVCEGKGYLEEIKKG